MKVQVLNIRGTQMNKIAFSEIEDVLEEKGMNVNECFFLMADEKEFIYVSNGFLQGLRKEENDIQEWHHYFKKEEDGNFIAGKLNF